MQEQKTQGNIEVYEALDNLITVALKLASSSDLADRLEESLDTALCISREGFRIVDKEVSLRDIIRLLRDPEVKRGLYIILALIKNLGRCYKPS